MVSADLAFAGAVWFLSDSIHKNGIQIRKEIGAKQDEQTKAIKENAQGLAVLKEQVTGLDNRVDRLDRKIDRLSPIQLTSY